MNKSQRRQVFIGGVYTGVFVVALGFLAERGIEWLIWAHQFIDTNIK